MKITHTLVRLLFAIVILWTSSSPMLAQDLSQSVAADQQVLALSHEGIALKAPAKLQVGVHALQASYPKFLIGLTNKGGGYVRIRIKDRKGKNIHRPIFCYQKALVVTFDMQQVAAGSYLVEVTNQSECYRYHLQVGSKVVTTLEVKPGVLAKAN